MKKQYVLVDGVVKVVKAGVNPDEAINRLRGKGYDVKKIGNPPTNRTMEKWIETGVAKATDGCRVEYDGECPHGHKSWLIQLGMV